MNNILILTIASVALLTSCNNDQRESFAFGNFEADEIIISAEMSGILKEFNVTEGTVLEKDSILGYIDTTQLVLKKSQVHSGIKSVISKIKLADEQIKVNEVNLKNLTREKSRIEALLGDGAATPKQLDDIVGQIDLLGAQTNVLSSQKNSINTEIETLGSQIAQINDQLTKSYIKSPLTGTVMEKYLHAGELAVTGKALFKIADLSSLILRVFVEGDQLEMIRLGNDVKVFVDTAGGELKEYAGKVAWISSAAEFTPKIIQTKEERVNLVYAVKIIVTNDGGLKIGMPAEITVTQ